MKQTVMGEGVSNRDVVMKRVKHTGCKLFRYTIKSIILNDTQYYSVGVVVTLMISCPRTPPTMAQTGPSSAKQYLYNMVTQHMY